MLIFLYDYETTGLNPDINGICEYACAIWDTTHNRVVRSGSFFVYDAAAVWEDQSILPHGITPEICQQYGVPQDKAFRQFSVWAAPCSVFVAWNGKQFDFPWWTKWAARNGAALPQGLQLDPMVDIRWPKKWYRELFYVAAKHGIINHFAHSGCGDVMTMVELLARHTQGGVCPICGVERDLGAILEWAKMPEIWIEGQCSIDDRDRVKVQKYNWLPWPQPAPPNTKPSKWIKKIKEGLLDEEIAKGQIVGAEYKVVRLT